MGDVEPQHEEAARIPGMTRRRVPLLLSNRPWVMMLHYAALACVLAALGWAGLWDVFSVLPERVSPWFTLITALPASALLTLKRRAPGLGLGVAIVLFTIDLGTVGGLVPLLVVLELLYAYLLALRPEQRRRVMWQIVVSTAILALTALVKSEDLQVTVMIALQFGALLGFTFWYSNSMAQSAELVGLYRQRSESAERLAAAEQQAAVQGERDRMARELHDVVAGHISAIAIRSEAALAARPATDDSLERSALRAVRDASLEAHSALRSMIQVLRSGDGIVSPPPGRATLPQLIEAANASGVSARLVDHVLHDLPAPVDQVVGSVVREALANSVRHSSGAEVAVLVAEEVGTVRVEVVSTGGGALSTPNLTGSGMGLQLLAERVRALGGELDAGPRDSGAWAVRATVPKEMPA